MLQLFRQIERFHEIFQSNDEILVKSSILEEFLLSECVLSCIVKVNEMHFRNLWSGRIGLLHPSGCLFHPSGSKNSSLGPSALGMNFFFPWDEIHPSGCKTQFFLSAGYEIPHFIVRQKLHLISRKLF